MFEPTESHRDALMHALAAAETVASRMPDLPHDMKVVWSYSTGFSIELYFHHSAEKVARFGNAFDAELLTQSHSDEDPRAHTHADAVVDGHPVHAWSLAAHGGKTPTTIPAEAAA